MAYEELMPQLTDTSVSNTKIRCRLVWEHSLVVARVLGKLALFTGTKINTQTNTNVRNKIKCDFGGSNCYGVFSRLFQN